MGLQREVGLKEEVRCKMRRGGGEMHPFESQGD